MPRDCSALFAALPAALCAALFAGVALAQSVVLVGVFGDRAALLQIDGGSPRRVVLGERVAGVSLLSVAQDRATIERDGKRQVLILGQMQGSGGERAAPRPGATLAADSAGHFFAEGTINGGYVRFLVDTGATLVAIPARDAQRLGIDYRKGRRGVTQTANGPAPAYVVTLDSVKVGDIELHGIDAVVLESGLNIALLGMTFLNRLEMRRNGATMVLQRQY